MITALYVIYRIIVAVLALVVVWDIVRHLALRFFEEYACPGGEPGDSQHSFNPACSDD